MITTCLLILLPLSMALHCDHIDYDLNDVRYQKPIGVCHTDINIGGAGTSIILTCNHNGSDVEFNYYPNQQCSGSANSTQTLTELMAEKGHATISHFLFHKIYVLLYLPPSIIYNIQMHVT